jgi:hypothetical protein
VIRARLSFCGGKDRSPEPVPAGEDSLFGGNQGRRGPSASTGARNDNISLILRIADIAEELPNLCKARFQRPAFFPARTHKFSVVDCYGISAGFVHLLRGLGIQFRHWKPLQNPLGRDVA